MIRTFVAVAAVGLMVTACGGSKPGSGAANASGGGASTTATGTSPTTVMVKDFAFTPGNLTVNKGTKVTWKFLDTTDHNVTANDNSFKSKDLKSGGTYSRVFNTAGKYSYICSIHQYMTGTVTVK